MRLTLLGTGDAGGMPWYGCDCFLCQRAQADPHYRRGPACALLEIDTKNYLIDAGAMDISERFPPSKLDGIFLTHFHPDHVQGLFHLRWGTGKKIPVYCPPDTIGCADLFKHHGILDFQPQKKYLPFSVGALNITPLPLIHSKPTLGYLIEHKDQRLAYLVDTKGLPPGTEQHLSAIDLQTLIVDTTLPPGIDSKNHNNLNDSLSLHKKLAVNKTILTHIGHDLDLWLNAHGTDLPETVVVGYDGMIAFP